MSEMLFSVTFSLIIVLLICTVIVVELNTEED
ncbi:hypothetical protein JOC48_003805 [Aquibacillus albus]|uniref:Holin-like toxin n=1 Tax=Aquibacillus albus TaxID=1168171 RepID=A0ABS2N554_9BACI|nr:hypothetical protein [Aquibacillus albus]